MVDFSIGFDEDSDVKRYLLQIRDRIEKVAYLDVKILFQPGFAFFHIKPLIFPIYWFSPVVWVSGYLIQGYVSETAFYFGAIPGISFLFYMKEWYQIGLFLGKLRGKFKGKMVYL